jgi:hypothetical protein
MDILWVLWYSVLGIASSIVFLGIEFVEDDDLLQASFRASGRPIVGNLLQLGKKPNKSFFHLATKYGPFMSLSE